MLMSQVFSLWPGRQLNAQHWRLCKTPHGAERFRAQGVSTRPRFVVRNLLILNKSTGVADVQRERQSQRERKLAFIMNVSSDNKAQFAYHNPNLSCSDQVRCEGIFFLVAFESL